MLEDNVEDFDSRPLLQVMSDPSKDISLNRLFMN